MSGFAGKIAFYLIIIVGISILGTPANAQDEQITDIVFDGKPNFSADTEGNFTSCGFEAGAVGGPFPSPANWSLAPERWSVTILVTRTRNASYAIQAITAKGQSKDTQWVPIRNVIKWVRIGNLPPIVASPYNIVAIPEQGVSYAVVGDKKIDWISHALGKKTAFSASIYYPLIRMTKLYSGIIEIGETSSAQIKQCLESH